MHDLMQIVHITQDICIRVLLMRWACLLCAIEWAGDSNTDGAEGASDQEGTAANGVAENGKPTESSFLKSEDDAYAMQKDGIDDASSQEADMALRQLEGLSTPRWVSMPTLKSDVKVP